MQLKVLQVIEHEYVTLEHIVLSHFKPEILMICEQLEVDVDIIVQDIENYLDDDDFAGLRL